MAVAARRNLFNMAKLLIKEGSDVNARDINGRGPLYHAVICRHFEMANLLIANMASVFAFDFHGVSVQQLALDPAIKNCLQKGHFVSLPSSTNIIVPTLREVRASVQVRP